MKCIKTTCVLNFYIIYCCCRLLMLSWYRQLWSIYIMMIAQKLTLRMSPPKLPCPGTAPVPAINSKFWGKARFFTAHFSFFTAHLQPIKWNMPRFVLGKVRKLQDPRLFRKFASTSHMNKKVGGSLCPGGPHYPTFPYHDDRPKTYFTNVTSQITMPWNRPCSSYQFEIFREYAQICFRKSQKIAGS